MRVAGKRTYIDVLRVVVKAGRVNCTEVQAGNLFITNEYITIISHVGVLIEQHSSASADPLQGICHMPKGLTSNRREPID